MTTRAHGDTSRAPSGPRVRAEVLADIRAGLSRKRVVGELLAGATLLAIAIPEQLATSRLALVPAFSAMIAFITATLVFSLFGSNPIMSVGADSTIAPLFAVALTQLAAPYTSHYLELVATSAVVTGVLVTAVGLARLGWIADFLSLPIVAGFMAGVGVIIFVHQLPDALGVAGGGGSIPSRLHVLATQLSGAHVAAIVLAVATLLVMVVGERWNPRLPWALGAIGLATLATAVFSLGHHGVAELGAVSAGLPRWRLGVLSAHEWSVVVTTSITVAVVILSQSAATTRNSSDELGVGEDVGRDFVGVGVANIAAGAVGSFPVDASPPRTTVVRLAGGRTRVAGLAAAVAAIALSPLAPEAHVIPLSALAGVLCFIAGRLVRVARFEEVWSSSRLEFTLSIVSGLGVVVLGVEQGLALAVGLAVLSQTWRSSRPHLIELGRRHGTTSWEPLGVDGVDRVDRILVVLFDKDLFFANANAFRRLLHAAIDERPHTKHLVIDAVAMSDVDYTGAVVLAQAVEGLEREGVGVSIARASAFVRARIEKAPEGSLRKVHFYESVDDAATKRH